MSDLHDSLNITKGHNPLFLFLDYQILRKAHSHENTLTIPGRVL